MRKCTVNFLRNWIIDKRTILVGLDFIVALTICVSIINEVFSVPKCLSVEDPTDFFNRLKIIYVKHYHSSIRTTFVGSDLKKALMTYEFVPACSS